MPEIEEAPLTRLELQQLFERAEQWQRILSEEISVTAQRRRRPKEPIDPQF